MKFGDQVKEFLNMGNKIFEEKDAIADYDQLLDDKKELEEKLATKTQEYEDKVKEIATLQAAADERVATAETKSEGFIEQFQKRFKEWDAATSKESKLESQIETLKQELTDAKTKAQSAEAGIGVMQDKLFASQNKMVDMEKELILLKKEHSSRMLELKGTRGELQACQTEMEKEKRELGLEYPLVEDLAKLFRNLSEGVHSMAKNFFCVNLPEELPTEDLWNRLDTSGFLKLAPRKMPLSNSMAARCLRMATAERIIGDKLSTEIFRQFYLPHSTTGTELINEITNHLDKRSSFKAAVFRLQLLAAYEVEEELFVAHLVEKTTVKVVKILEPLLCAPGSLQDFHSALRKLFQEAVKLWQSVQRSASKSWVTNDPESRHYNNDQDNWEQNEDYDTAVGLTNEQKSQIPEDDEPLIPLFPQVSMGNDVIYPGCALWSDQNAVVSASIEFSQTSRSVLLGRMVRRDSDRRRMSSGAWKVEDPSKPPLSPSANYHSFLERADSRPGSRRPSPPIRKATPPVTTPPASPPALKPIEVGGD